MAAETTERNDMLLPEGKTCGDCRHFARCERLIDCERTNIECDWAPSRFKPLPAPTQENADEE